MILWTINGLLDFMFKIRIHLKFVRKSENLVYNDITDNSIMDSLAWINACILLVHVLESKLF